MGRIIAIGDVHGCSAELAALLEQIGPQPADTLIQLGDLINRGPDSAGAIALARRYQVKCLLGNHESRLLRYHWSKDPTLLKKYDFETLEQLSRDDWLFLEAMPLFHHDPYTQTVFVHAGFFPQGVVPWFRQSAEILTEIQVLDAQKRPAKRSQAPDGTPWADLWTGPPYVLYGHTPRDRIYRRPWSLGLDTSCVYGGHLTACILPGLQIIQVKAEKAYAESRTLPSPVAAP